MENLIHIIYASRAAVPFTENELQELLALSRSNNAAIDVTGMLLHCEGSFFQVLEGEEAVVNALYAKIGRDPRHDEVVKVISESINERAFDEWSMGYARASRAELKEIEGLNDFFLGGACLTEIDLGRSRKLLQAFAKGQWRQAS